VGRAGPQDGAERVAVGVGVVGEHALAGRHRQRVVVAGAVVVGGRDRGRVRDLDADRGRGAGQPAVADGVGEGVPADPLGGRRVQEAAVGLGTKEPCAGGVYKAMDRASQSAS
jgi:hypothetical protein